MGRNVFGYRAIEELLRASGARATLLVSRRNPRLLALRELAGRRGVKVRDVEESELTSLCGTAAHKGAVLAIGDEGESRRAGLAEELRGLAGRETALALALDGITDPQNLGAILRSADQFGVELVLLPSHRAARETPSVERVSAGASAYVPLVVVANIASSLALLKHQGFWVYGAEARATPAHRIQLKGRVCLVLGSEGGGMHRLVRERCDGLVGIPAVGHVESFNVSVAAAILMYEVRRQQGFFEARASPTA